MCILPHLTSSAGNPKRTPPDNGPVVLEHADQWYYDEYEHPGAQRLSGKVVFRHAGKRMTCDSAVLYQASQSFEAFGNVHLIQGDTLSLKGKHMFYDGLSQTSYITRDVVARHRQQMLYTDSLFYDDANKFFLYETGGRLVDGENDLTSDYGKYHTDSRQAVFRYNVKLRNAKDSMISDVLYYNTRTREAKVDGNSNIFSGDYNIFTTDGQYNAESEIVEMFKRSKLNNPRRQLYVEADKVYYDKTSGILKAWGNVYSHDRRNKCILIGDTCEYYDYPELKKDSSMVTGQALAKDYSNGKDTLFVHADTMKMLSINVKTDSVYRVVRGIRHARAWRNDVQAVADTLLYDTRTRCLNLYKDPIAWTDNRQVLGEEINIFANDSTVDSIYVQRQALIVEQVDSLHFNQIACQLMKAYFEEGEMNLGIAEGNVSCVMFPLERDSLILYHNYLETSLMKMYMEKRELQKVWTPAAQCATYALGMAPAERTRLSNFAWFDYIRPKGPDDLFLWRSKNQGLELKAVPRRQAPLQNLR